jgi:hypothetical protein
MIRRGSRDAWIVCLGEDEWRRFTAGGDPADGLRMLGSVRRGAQIGALARDANGRYVQINGDYRTELNQAQIAAALQHPRQGISSSSRTRWLWGGTHRSSRDSAPPSPAAPSPTVRVVVRRRRTCEPV